MFDFRSTIRNALAGVALALTSTGGAQALSIAPTVDVTFAGDVITIGTLTGTFEDNADLLESQPWFSSETEAMNFADLVGSALGEPNVALASTDVISVTTPLFAFALVGTGSETIRSRGLQQTLGGLLPAQADLPITTEATFAVVVDDVAPIPLPPAAFLLLGGLGALGLVKRRRA